MIGLLTAQVQVMFDSPVVAVEQIAEFGKLIVDETEKWGRVVKFAGLKPT